MIGKYYKRIYSETEWVIVIPIEEPNDRTTLIECTVVKEFPELSMDRNKTDAFFHVKLIPMTEEEVMLELL